MERLSGKDWPQRLTGYQKATAKSKVIILLTDGKEDAPDTRLIDPLTALEIAKAKGVKVYSIGMGARPSTIVEITSNKPRKRILRWIL